MGLAVVLVIGLAAPLLKGSRGPWPWLTAKQPANNDPGSAAAISALAAPSCSAVSPSSNIVANDSALQIRAEQTTLPAGLDAQILAGTQRAYRQWESWIGEQALEKPSIKLRFLGDAQQFQEIYGKPNGEQWTTTGFYRTRSNEVLILHTPPYRDQALGNAFHEVSHLITAWQLGATPPWLNEGLAEYYETLDVTPGSNDFLSSAAHLALLKTRGSLGIQEITQLTQLEWMQRDAERRYASAWALTAFLMASEEGTKTLARVIKHAYTQRCAARPDLTKVLGTYPGGLSALESHWMSWLARQR